MPSLSEKRRAQAEYLRSIAPSEQDPHETNRGVLLSDEIIFYAENCNLIAPFNRANLKPAGYELTVGDEYFINGTFLELDTEKNDKSKIVIPPFEVAILKTTEILRIPRYMIARWNIRVRHAYSGLLWVGGPQVDPGYVGHLFCPIYNLSDREVTLRAGEPLALIDFAKTTPFDPNKPESELRRYNFPPKRSFLEDYDVGGLKSALFTRAGQKLVEFDEQIKTLESRFITFTQLSFTIFALVIALIALMSRVNADSISLSTAFFGAITVGLSIAALLIAIFSYVRMRVGRIVYEQYGQVTAKTAEAVQRYLHLAWWRGVAFTALFAFGVCIGFYLLTEPAFRDIRQQRVLTKSDLDQERISVKRELDRLRQELEQKTSPVKPGGQ